MKPARRVTALLARTTLGKQLTASQRDRMVLFAAGSFVFDLLYALYHGVLGVVQLSLWLVVMCAFYAILAVTRFSVVLCDRRCRGTDGQDTEWFVMGLTGVLLMALSAVLAGLQYISESRQIAAKHGEIVMISIAAYTFLKIILAIIRAVKQRRNPSPLLRTIRTIGYAEAAASLLTMQRSMLVSFEEMAAEDIRLLNGLTGAGVWLFILLLGIALTVRSRKRERNVSNDRKIKAGRSQRESSGDGDQRLLQNRKDRGQRL